MNEATTFRLIIRGLGVLFLGMGLPSALSAAWSVVTSLGSGQSTGLQFGVYLALHLVLPAIGIYLLFFADGLIRACLRDAMGRCPSCGFNARQATGGACPGCGSPIAPPTAGSRSGTA